METVKDFLNTDLVAGQTIANIIWFFSGVVGTFLVAKVLQGLFRGRLKKLVEKSKTQFDDILLDTLDDPIYWIVLLWGLSYSVTLLALPAAGVVFVGNVSTIAITMLIAWSASRLITLLRGTYLDPLIDQSESKLDDQIVPIIENALKAAIWILALLVAFSNMGYDLMSVLTGLGIGGLALAMAAKDTLSNVFGSLTIFADRPFQVDDVVKIGGHAGTVTEVGLRTCRIKTFDGTVVTMPNGSLVGGAIENLSAREARKFGGVLKVPYDTDSATLKAMIAAIDGLLADHECVRDGASVRFGAFGDTALEISLKYWVAPPGAFFNVVAELNMAIKERFEAEGWRFAPPTMALYRASA